MKRRRSLCLSTVVSMSLTTFCTPLAMLPVQAQEAADSVQVSIDDNAVSIGNGQIEREFAISDGRIQTTAVINRRINRTLAPEEGSEDFIIRTLAKGQKSDEPVEIENRPEWIVPEALDRSQWKATLTNGAGQAFTDASVATLFDGDLDTNPDEYQKPGHPFTLTIQLPKTETVASMSVDKRPGYGNSEWGVNGTMGKFTVEVSTDGTTWTKACEGEFTEEDYQLHQEGNLYNVGRTVHANFDNPVQASWIRLTQKSTAIGTPEEFTSSEINFYPEKWQQKVVNPSQVLDRSEWTGTITDNTGTEYPESDFGLLIDGDLDSYVNSYNTNKGYPVTIEMDLQSEQTVSSFSLDKRPGFHESQYGVNGTTGKYEVYVSSDAQTWSMAGRGNFTREAWNLHDNADGSLHNIGDRVYANLNKTVQARYVRIVQLSDALGSTEEMSLAEVNLYSDAYQGPDWRTNNLPDVKSEILSSQLTFESAVSEDTENGKKLTIHYAPFEAADGQMRVDEIFELDAGKDYMRSHLEISADDLENLYIDSIDQDSFVIPAGDMDTTWTHPDEAGKSTIMQLAHELMLGQPIYIDGMYMGSEFPVAETEITEGVTQVRYYSGKNFERLGQDGQLREDGVFETWPNVIGSARGTTKAEVQSDFYDYIQEIATPTRFRKQYNSWYDNMMNITDASIEKSFVETEDGLSRWGVEPLDSYVIDDGWNNYYDGKHLTTPGSDRGTVENRTGFWEINDKFPNDFYTSSRLANKLGGSFGVWIGPQGGYNYYSQFGDFLQEMGTGEKGSSALCTGSRIYIKNYEQLAENFQKDYGVEYWKWDGFALRPCTNSEHAHMSGGPQNMYYTSDMWEAWTDLFENVRADNASRGRGLFINATCYVTPSPWLLQWVNTVWLQESGDTGHAGSGERHQTKMYYRDNVYYNLLNTFDLQFPLKNFYDHDPIYGVSDNSNATDEVFREYLFANAMRGTAFWELYYSPSLMNDEKYAITSDVLDWAQTNQDILKNVKMFGSRPTAGVYGYSGWNGSQGIVSFTNPLSTAASYDLKLDSQVGAVPALADASAIQIHPFAAGTLEQTYSYGDTLHVELKAHETKIFQFNTPDQGAPEVVSCAGDGEDGVILHFNQRVMPQSAALDGKEAQAVLLDDNHSVKIDSSALKEDLVSVSWTVLDAFGNEHSGQTEVPVYEGGQMSTMVPETEALSYDAQEDRFWLENPQGDVLPGTFDSRSAFTLQTAVQSESKNVTLFNAEGALKLTVDDQGYLQVAIGDQENAMTSRQDQIHVLEKAHGLFNTDAYVPALTETVRTGMVADGKAHTISVVRAANGLCKLYVDLELTDTVYLPGQIGARLSAETMTMGSEGFTGLLQPASIADSALDAKLLRSEAQTNWDAVMADRSGWTASACSEENATTGDANAAAAIDGNLASWWHSNYKGKDSHAVNQHWIQIDFHKEEAFDTFYYTGRGAATNGSIKDFILELLDQDGNIIESINGTFDGSADRCAVSMNGEKHAWGVRLRVVNTHNGANYATAKEIEISRRAEPMSDEDLALAKAALLEKASALPIETATDASASAVKTILAKVNLADSCNSIAWQRLAESFDEAAAALVDASALRSAIASAGALTASDYTAESYAVLSEALDQARLTARKSTDAAQVAQALEALNAAVDGLVKTDAKCDKTLLVQAVQYAEEKEAAGALEGINVLVKARFEEALAGAKAVLASETASQNEVDEAWTELSYAIHLLGFKADKTSLQTLVNEASAIDPASLPEGAAKDAFLAALEKAQGVLDSETALQQTIDEAYQELADALASLEMPEVDTRLLAWLTTSVENTDLNDYADIPGTKEAFTSALEAARAVLADPVSQQAVDQALSDLSDAYLALRLRPDEEMLRTLRSFAEQVEALDPAAYTAESYEKLAALGRQARVMLNDSAADRESVQQFIDSINAPEIQNLLAHPDGKTADASAKADQSASVKQSVKTSAATGFGALLAAGAAAVSSMLYGVRRRRNK